MTATTTTTPTIVTVDGVDIAFNMTDEAFNGFLNNQSPKNRVNTAFNFLMKVVHEDSKEDLKAKILTGTTPKGMVVMSIIGELADVVGGNIDISIKKPQA